MNKEELCDAFTLIDDRYIIEADIMRLKKTSIVYYIRRFGIAFMIPIILCLLLFFQSTFNTTPLTPLEYNPMDSGGFGFNSTYTKDLNTLVENNPWKEGLELKKLPVFKNYVTYGEHTVSSDRFDRMKEILEFTSKYFGVDEKAKRWTSKDNTEIYVANDEVEITVNENLNSLIYFKNGVKLPSQYNFSADATKEELTKVGKYLINQYKDLMNYKEPKLIAEPRLAIYNPEIFELNSYEISVYDGSDSIENQMINYGMNKTVFYCNENRQLDTIRIYYTDTEEKIGDYPIMDIDQAKEQFIKENKEIKKEDILKTEMVYLNKINNKYLIPYYKFYVNANEDHFLVCDIPSDIYQLKVYYIPAIEEKYIVKKSKEMQKIN